MNKWTGGAWSFVYVGCKNAPNSSCGSGPNHVNVDSTPLIAEKPYIVENNG